MTVNEMIAELSKIQTAGRGDAQVYLTNHDGTERGDGVFAVYFADGPDIVFVAPAESIPFGSIAADAAMAAA